MNPTDIGLSIGTSLGVIGVIGAIFGWASWHVYRRWRGRALLATWLVASIVITALMTLRIRHEEVARGFTPEQQARVPIFWWFLPMWIVALGLVALGARRHAASGAQGFSFGRVVRSFGASLLGALAYFIAFALWDVLALF